MIFRLITYQLHWLINMDVDTFNYSHTFVFVFFKGNSSTKLIY